MKRLAIIVIALTVSSPASAAPDAMQGQLLFAKSCATCHDDSAVQERLQGPPLFGVVGRTVGSARRFGYSDALRAANVKGQIWTDKTLDAYLADPAKFAPGGFMPLAVVGKADRSNLIAYLKTLKPKP